MGEPLLDPCFDESVERMPPLERERGLQQKLGSFLRQAYENASAVKGIFERAGVTPSQVQSIRDLEKLPITRKDDLSSLQRADLPFGGFLAVPVASLSRIFVSPGPIYDPEAGTELFERTIPALYASGFRTGDIVLNTGAYQLVPGPLLLEESLKAMGITVIPAGAGNTELQVQIARELKVTGFASFVTFLMAIIKKAEEMGYDFRRDFCLTHALHIGEALAESLRRSLKEDYGVNVTQAYGTAELGVLGYECSQKSGFHFSENTILEIVDSSTGKQLGPGEVGEVVATPFNHTYPLLRIGTGDLSYFTSEPCPCGRTSNRLVKILGRVGDAVKVRGLFLHPKEVERALAHFPEVSRFQIIVGRSGLRDELSLNVEVRPGTVTRMGLEEDIASYVGAACRLKIDRVGVLAAGSLLPEQKAVLDRRTWD